LNIKNDVAPLRILNSIALKIQCQTGMTISVSSPFPIQHESFDPVGQYELLAAWKSLQFWDHPKEVVVKLCDRIDLLGHRMSPRHFSKKGKKVKGKRVIF